MQLKLLAVYGTLRGKENILKTERLEGFEMFSLGGFPMIIPNDNESVVIDIMNITDDELRRYDRYESVPNLYTREIVKTSLGNTYIYVPTIQTQQREKEKVEGGDWLK